jgi:hypothetical protein
MMGEEGLKEGEEVERLGNRAVRILLERKKVNSRVRRDGQEDADQGEKKSREKQIMQVSNMFEASNLPNESPRRSSVGSGRRVLM